MTFPFVDSIGLFFVWFLRVSSICYMANGFSPATKKIVVQPSRLPEMLHVRRAGGTPAPQSWRRAGKTRGSGRGGVGAAGHFRMTRQWRRTVACEKSPTIGSRFLRSFCSAWTACGRTLKASHPIAQGKRSGVAAKRHPGFGFNDPFQPCKGCTDGCGTLSGFMILPPTANPGRRCACPGLWD